MKCLCSGKRILAYAEKTDYNGQRINTGAYGKAYGASENGKVDKEDEEKDKQDLISGICTGFCADRLLRERSERF